MPTGILDVAQYILSQKRPFEVPEGRDPQQYFCEQRHALKDPERRDICDRFTRANLPLIPFMAQRLKKLWGRMDVEEVYEIGMDTMARSVEKFEASESKFSWYFKERFKWALLYQLGKSKKVESQVALTDVLLRTAEDSRSEKPGYMTEVSEELRLFRSRNKEIDFILSAGVRGLTDEFIALELDFIAYNGPKKRSGEYVNSRTVSRRRRKFEESRMKNE